MKYSLLIVLMGWLGVSFGQEPQTRQHLTFSLDEAVAYAEQHAYEVVSAGYEMQQAKKKIWETIAMGLPQVNVTANYNDNLELPTALLPKKMMGGAEGEYLEVKFGQQYTTDATIMATQLIFDGSYLVGLKASKVFYKLSENKLEKVKQMLREGVMQAYFFVLTAEENAKTLQENLEMSQKTYEEIKAYFDEGLREDTDADQAQLAVTNIKQKLEEAKRSITVARMTLKYLLGINVDMPIKLSSTLDNLLNDVVLLGGKTQEVKLENHIDYRILETQKKAQHLMVKREKSMYLPRLSAFYRYGKNVASDEWNVFKSGHKWYTSSMVGLKFSVPIFSSGMRHSKVQQQKLGLELLEHKMTQKLQEMQKQKRLAEGDLETARANYLTSVESKRLAKKIYDKTKLKYTEGVSNSFELTQNEQQYLKAHGVYIGAVLQLLKANVAYKKAVGEL
ncbi:MAG: TolC family protein [Flavobacteriaceae bacterium]|nr:TolC family protein [Flavobacteriaceae bacterium]